MRLFAEMRENFEGPPRERNQITSTQKTFRNSTGKSWAVSRENDTLSMRGPLTVELSVHSASADRILWATLVLCKGGGAETEKLVTASDLSLSSKRHLAVMLVIG